MKGKILAGLLITFLAIVLVGYFSFQSLSRLVTTMEEESRPNPKNLQLKEILFDLSNAESAVRAYTITWEASYLTPFYQSTSTIDDKLTRLEKITRNDSLESVWLDSLSELIVKKYFAMNDLIELKKDDSRQEILDDVLDNIARYRGENLNLETIDTPEPNQNSIKLPEIVPIEIQGLDGEEKDATQRKRPSIFERLFGKKKKGDLVVVSQTGNDSTSNNPDSLIAEVPVPNETVIETNNRSDRVSKLDLYKNELMDALERLKKDRENSTQIAIEEELALFELDNSIMDDIRQLVDKFESRERLISNEHTSNAELLTAKTKERIAWIGGGSVAVFILLVIVIFRDLTINNLNKKKLQVAKDDAEKLAKVKEEFLSNISHEIRTPINSILGFANQLEKTNLESRQKAYIEVVKKSSSHLLALINDVLDYSKLESGRVNLEEIGFKPKLCVVEVQEALQPFAQSKKLKFYNEFGEIPEVLIGDPVRLRQIIINLVNNAIKFTPKGSVAVKVTSEVQGKKCLLKVAVIDTGIGIKEENLNSIFQTFNQADNSTTREYGGTGLGLSICKKLLEAQNGKIRAESKPGTGSKFEFEIPYLVGSEEDLPEIKKVSEIRQGIVKNKKVMIVDDEPYNLLLFKTMLENHSIQAFTFESAIEVLEIIKVEKFDLILMDIQMPGMDGISLAKKLRIENEIKIPILALTANTSASEKTKCIEAGFDGFLIKPVEEQTLINTIASFVGWEQIEEPEKTFTRAIDLDGLFEMGNNDLDFVYNMLNLFVKNYSQNMEDMKVAIKENDRLKIEMRAHKMIPPCRHLGLNEMVKTLKMIELGNENKNSLNEIENWIKETELKGEEILKVIRIELEKIRPSKITT